MVLTPTSVKTGSYNVANGQLALFDCSGSNGICSVPTYPNVGDKVGLKIVASAPGNKVILAGLPGLAEFVGKNCSGGCTLMCCAPGDVVECECVSAGVWEVKIDEVKPAAAMAFVSNSAQVIPNNTETQLTLAAISAYGFDFGGANEVKIQRTGRYQVFASVGFNTGGVLVFGDLRLKVNGTPRTTMSLPTGSASANFYLRLSDVLDLVEGDVLTMTMRQISTNSSNKTVMTSIDGRPTMKLIELRS